MSTEPADSTTTQSEQTPQTSPPIEADEVKKPDPVRRLTLIVLCVIVVLFIWYVAADRYAPWTDEARVQKAYADFKSIETALQIYKLDNFNYPSTEQGLQALVSRSSIDPEPRNFRKGGYLNSLPIDPWGEPYLYLAPGENADFDLYTLGADAVTGGEEQNEDIGNWLPAQNE